MYTQRRKQGDILSDCCVRYPFRLLCNCETPLQTVTVSYPCRLLCWTVAAVCGECSPAPESAPAEAGQEGGGGGALRADGEKQSGRVAQIVLHNKRVGLLII